MSPLFLQEGHLRRAQLRYQEPIFLGKPRVPPTLLLGAISGLNDVNFFTKL